MIIKTAWDHYLRSWRSHSIVQTATIVVMTFTVVIWTSFYVIEKNLRSLLTVWGDQVEMTVFLAEELSDGRPVEIEAALKEMGVFSQIEYMSKDDAAKDFFSRLGHLSKEFLAHRELGNPLPASFNLRLAEGVRSSRAFVSLESLAQELAHVEGVEDIAYGQGWVENYAMVLRGYEWVSRIILLGLVLAAALVVHQSIGNSVFQRREEIEILELVGARPERVRAPFVFEGAINGLVSGLLGCVLVVSGFLALREQLGDRWSAWGLVGYWQGLGWQQIVLALVLSTTLSAFAAFLSVRKIASGWAAAQSGD